MFKHLLVPLDGSHLAEAALPAAAFLADRLGATVTLVHIIERDAPQEVHGERHLTKPGDAYAYLAEVTQRVFPPDRWPDGRIEQHVHTAETADVARGIVGHVEELAPDLIIMCTHGSSGLRDAIFGSIAQQVASRGTIPVLLIRPAEPATGQAFDCRRLLVPMDGNPDHEQGLPAAAELARACAAEVQLLFVVPTLGTLAGQEAATGRLLPGATSAMLDLRQQEAETYLRERAEGLQSEGVRATIDVRRGDPASAIVEAAQSIGADMIVLGTHGRAGIDAFWAGSTAAKISGRSSLPLLLVPVSGPAAA